MSIIALSKVRPWLLWMVIAQARRSGYCVKVPSFSSSMSLVSSLVLNRLFSHTYCSTLMGSWLSSGRTWMWLSERVTMVPIFPLKNRCSPEGSFLMNITLAPCFSWIVFSVG